MNSEEILYTAAHSHFPDTEPLGGGKAVADYLTREHPDWTVLSPRTTGITLTKPLAAMSEWQYAKFCRQFEHATTTEIRRCEPTQCVVLTNDISEGPDFAALKNYRLVSIWHVDVVDYFTKFYLRGWVPPEAAAKLPWPRIVFRKQRDCVRHSRRIVVPSQPMKEVILRCYPWCPPERIVVLPWGNIAPAIPAAPIGGDEVIILTLSRLSPEKGIERLLATLPQLTGNVRVWIAGAPAYMKGQRYAQKLRRLADSRVEFLGHATGERKAAILQRADIFVSPSRHESYGLTIEEARAAGCRVVSHGHYGASGTVINCDKPDELATVLNGMVRVGRTVKATTPPVVSDAAARLAQVLAEVAASR